MRAIILMGRNGYIGSAFARELNRRKQFWITVPWQCSFTSFMDTLETVKPELVINCAAFIPTPSVDLCAKYKSDTVKSNVLLPAMLAQACELAEIPFAHISTGCLYGEDREYTEEDVPTRDFEGYAGFYLVSKLISEDVVRKYEKSWVWRIRLPFDERDHPKNYLSKLRTHKHSWAQTNSLTHRGDFVKAALDMVSIGAPYGVYSMCNPGSVKVSDLLGQMGIKPTSLVLGPVTGTVLSTAKLLSTGVKIRPVEDAVSEAIREWRVA